MWIAIRKIRKLCLAGLFGLCLAAPVAVTVVSVTPQHARAAAVVKPVDQFLQMAYQLLTTLPQIGLERALQGVHSAFEIVNSLVSTEDGDHDVWQTLVSIFVAQAPDAPMSPAEAAGTGYGNLPFKQIPLQINRLAYFQWQKVTLPADVATCADGTPYSFFVNLTPASTNLQITLEPGGVCTDWESCSGNQPVHKPDGSLSRPVQYLTDGQRSGLQGPIPEGTMWSLNVAAAIQGKELTGYAKITQPLASRFGVGLFGAVLTGATPLEGRRLRTQNWNMVHLPYCTGDIYVGNQTRVLRPLDAEAAKTAKDPHGQAVPNPMVRRFQGLVATQAALGWIRDWLPRPAQVYVTGQSAGASGLDILRPLFADFLNPSLRSYFVVDGGPLTRGHLYFNEAMYANPAYADWKGALTIAKALEVFTDLDTQNPENNFKPGSRHVLMLLNEVLARNVPGYQQSVVAGDFNQYLIDSYKVRPGNRTLYVGAYEDKIHSAYMFSKYPRLIPDGVMQDGDANLRYGKPTRMHSPYGVWLRDSWMKELQAIQARVDAQANPNVGYFFINGRTWNLSHCLTLGTYDNTTDPGTGVDAFMALEQVRGGWRDGQGVMRMAAPPSLSSGSLFAPETPTIQLLRTLQGSNSDFFIPI
ncbi:hypothetical protein LZ017_14500 [Pelomonas sp. CA6]|uniref:hypothetical protein n=1 Tax=Pelomonas sp. CA6 TaxID=2907999 RepID=UPI001F4BE55F|nr:hypothetical protein [Pelomonas sp. CA6]MCH7344588.1 hypothetical protein [Pelomonas sp. CA6]